MAVARLTNRYLVVHPASKGYVTHFSHAATCLSDLQAAAARAAAPACSRAIVDLEVTGKGVWGEPEALHLLAVPDTVPGFFTIHVDDDACRRGAFEDFAAFGHVGILRLQSRLDALAS